MLDGAMVLGLEPTWLLGGEGEGSLGENGDVVADAAAEHEEVPDCVAIGDAAAMIEEDSGRIG
jgi:hypothetical protein